MKYAADWFALCRAVDDDAEECVALCRALAKRFRRDAKRFGMRGVPRTKQEFAERRAAVDELHDAWAELLLRKMRRRAG